MRAPATPATCAVSSGPAPAVEPDRSCSVLGREAWPPPGWPRDVTGWNPVLIHGRGPDGGAFVQQVHPKMEARLTGSIELSAPHSSGAISGSPLNNISCVRSLHSIARQTSSAFSSAAHSTATPSASRTSAANELTFTFGRFLYKRSQTLTNTRKHSQTLANTRKHSQTLANTRKHSQTLVNTRKRSQTLANTHKHS